LLENIDLVFLTITASHCGDAFTEISSTTQIFHSSVVKNL